MTRYGSNTLFSEVDLTTTTQWTLDRFYQYAVLRRVLALSPINSRPKLDTRWRFLILSARIHARSSVKPHV